MSKRYTPEQAIRDVKAQRKRILRVLKPFAGDVGHPIVYRGKEYRVELRHLRAAAKLYRDMGGV